MTRPRPTVAEVIRSCLDEFLERVRLGADARATPRPEGPDLLPHGGPGWSRPGVPRVRASADRLQLLRQSPLPHLPGHGRGTVAGGPRRRIAPRAVLPSRLHAPGCPRPDRTGQSAGRLRPALAVRRRDRARGGRRSRAPGCPDRRVGRAAHLGPEPPVPPARPLRRARWRVVSGRHPLGRPLPSNFFLPVRVLSRVFRGKFLAGLRAAFAKGELRFAADQFERLLSAAVRTDWVVYAKPPFGGPEQVLKYLARYTHRVAISNARLLDFEDGMVRFRYKDYAHGNRKRVMTLTALEFVRRLLLHVLPTGFVRIRHYGILANRHRHEKLALCRRLLGSGSGGRTGVVRGDEGDPRKPVVDHPDPSVPGLWRGADDRDRGAPADAGRTGGSRGGWAGRRLRQFVTGSEGSHQLWVSQDDRRERRSGESPCRAGKSRRRAVEIGASRATQGRGSGG